MYYDTPTLHCGIQIRCGKTLRRDTHLTRRFEASLSHFGKGQFPSARPFCSLCCDCLLRLCRPCPMQTFFSTRTCRKVNLAGRRKHRGHPSKVRWRRSRWMWDGAVLLPSYCWAAGYQSKDLCMCCTNTDESYCCPVVRVAESFVNVQLFGGTKAGGGRGPGP